MGHAGKGFGSKCPLGGIFAGSPSTALAAMGGGNRYANEPQGNQVLHQIKECVLLQEHVDIAMAEVCMDNMVALRALRLSLERSLGVDLQHRKTEIRLMAQQALQVRHDGPNDGKTCHTPLDGMADIDSCGRQLFTRLHDEVGLSARWRGSWEPLDGLSSPMGVNDQKLFGMSIASNEEAWHTAGKLTASRLEDMFRTMDADLLETHEDAMAKIQNNESSPEVVRATSAYIKKIRQGMADDPYQTIDRGKYTLSQSGPLSERCVCFVDGCVASDTGMEFWEHVKNKAHDVDADLEKPKIMHSTALFACNILDTRSMMCSFLPLASGNSQGMDNVSYRKFANLYYTHPSFLCVFKYTAVDSVESTWGDRGKGTNYGGLADDTFLNPQLCRDGQERQHEDRMWQAVLRYLCLMILIR